MALRILNKVAMRLATPSSPNVISKTLHFLNVTSF